MYLCNESAEGCSRSNFCSCCGSASVGSGTALVGIYSGIGVSVCSNFSGGCESKIGGFVLDSGSVEDERTGGDGSGTS